MFDSMPAGDKAALQRCRTFIESTTCSRGDVNDPGGFMAGQMLAGDRGAQAMCFRNFSFEYARAAGGARRTMLMQAGCPPYVVGEEKRRRLVTDEEYEREKARLEEKLSTGGDAE